MEKKVSIKHAVSLHVRAAKALHSISPRFFPILTLYCVAAAVLPYVTVFFSAQLLKELALLRRASALRNWAIAGVLSTGLAAVLKAVLYQHKETLLDDLYGRKEILFARKMFSLDFAVTIPMTSPEVLYTGPPELPEFTAASNWNIFIAG